MIRPAVFCLCVLVFPQSSWTEDVPVQSASENLSARLVGKLGRPQALVFQGLKTFPEAELKEALAKDFDMTLAGSAQAKLEEYLKVLERRLTDGYLKSGFPSPKVSAEVEQEKIHVTIEEGRQYRNGEIHCDGPAKIDAATMKLYLTDKDIYKTPLTKPAEKDKDGQAKKTSKPTLWKADAIANFFSQPSKIYTEAIEAGFQAQGFFFPEFEVELKPADNGQAELWIHVKDTGPKATLGEITITGIQHHVREEILDYLKIKPGMPVDYRQKQIWEQKLQESNCFLESEILVLPTIAPGLPSDLIVCVVEQPHGPYLGELKHPEQDELLAKAAAWMTNWSQGGQGDSVMLMSANESAWKPRVMIISSPRDEGLVVDFEATPPAPHPPLHYTFIHNRDQTRLVSWHRQLDLKCKGVAGQFRGFQTFRYRHSKEDPHKWVLERGLNVAFGITNAKWESPVSYGIKILPADLVGSGRNPDKKIQRDQNVVSFEESKNHVLKLDAKTGRVIGDGAGAALEKIPSLKEQIFPALEGESSTIVYFQEGAFQRLLTHLDRETKDFSPAYHPQRPISSVLEFVLGEVEKYREITEQEDLPIGAFVKLLHLDALQPLDRLWIEHQAQTKHSSDFDLPISTRKKLNSFGLEKIIPFGLGRQLAHMAFSLHGLLVPAESGPARVGWNLALLCSGRIGEAMGNLDHLAEAAEVGPLTCWYASRVFGKLHKPWGKKFAETGLQKLAPEQFRYEMNEMLPKDSLLFELVGSLGNAVRQLDDAEFDQLATLLGKETNRPAVPMLVKQIRRGQGTPSRELLLESLVAIWTIRGQDFCRDHLEKLAAVPLPVQHMHKPNYEDVRMDALFPGKKSEKEKEAEKEPEKKLELFGASLPRCRNNNPNRGFHFADWWFCGSGSLSWGRMFLVFAPMEWPIVPSSVTRNTNP